MSLPTVIVAGTVNEPSGTSLVSGSHSVTFTTTAEIVDAAGNVIVPKGRSVKGSVVGGVLKAADGTSALTLYASDNGVTTVPYEVRESWRGGRQFTVNLLTTMVSGGHIAYSTLGPVTPPPTPNVPYATVQTVIAGDQATLAAAEAYTDSHAGAVASVNGHIGTVVLGASDVGADVSGAAAAVQTNLTAALAARAQLVSTDVDTNLTTTLSVNKLNYVTTGGTARTRALPTGQPLGTTVVAENADGAAAFTVTGSIRGVGSSSLSLTLAHEAVTFVADSAGSWWPLSGHKTLSSLTALFVPKPVSGDAVGSVPTKQADGSVLYAVPASGGSSSLPTVDTLTYPVAIAHRGCSNVFPENTIEAFEGAVSLGAKVIKFDVAKLADNGSALMHDTTVDRTTDGTGTVGLFTSSGARLLNVDASTWFSANWPNLKVPTLSDALDRLNNAPAVLIVQAKTTGTTAINQIANEATKRGMTRRVVISSSVLNDMTTIAAAGMPGLYQSGVGTETTPAAVAAKSAWAISMDYQALVTAGTLASQIAAYKAVGLKAVLYNVQRQAHYDAAVAAGADLINSDDTFYASRAYTTYRQTTAPWTRDGTFTHGQQGSSYISGDAEPGNGTHPRGDFTGSKGFWWWTFIGNSGYTLLGPFNPLANPNAYTITAQICFEGTLGGGSSFASIQFGNPDENNSNTVSGGLQSGMHIRAHPTGTVDLTTCPAGGGAGVVRKTVTGTAGQILTLSAGLTSGVAVTSLPVNALTVAVKVGHQFKLPTGQIATVSVAAAIGATAVSVSSVTPVAAVVSGANLQPVFTVVAVVTSTDITISRADESSAGSQTYVESTWRGGYMMCRGSGQDYSLGAVTIT